MSSAKNWIGKKVRLRASVREASVSSQLNETATVLREYPDIAGGVKLDKELAGFRSWNVEELELTPEQVKADQEFWETFCNFMAACEDRIVWHTERIPNVTPPEVAKAATQLVIVVHAERAHAWKWFMVLP